MKSYAIALTALLAGCASQTGVIPMSQGKLMITKQTGNAFLGISSLKPKVLQEAVSFYVMTVI